MKTDGWNCLLWEAKLAGQGRLIEKSQVTNTWPKKTGRAVASLSSFARLFAFGYSFAAASELD
jgi:hypothetical protein